MGVEYPILILIGFVLVAALRLYDKYGAFDTRSDSTSFPLLVGSNKFRAFAGKAGFGMTSNKIRRLRG